MERVRLNVGGCIFVTLKKTLSKIPNTRLSNLDKNCPEYDATGDEYFFDRNPHAFVSILDLYRTSELHIPSYACGISLRNELDFWNINPMHMSKCCWKTYFRVDEDLEIMNNISGKFGEINSNKDEIIRNCESFKSRIWQFLEHPYSSSGAKIFNALILISVVLSIAVFCLGTHPLFRTSYESTIGSMTSNRSNDVSNATDQIIRSITRTTLNHTLLTLDFVCMAIIIIECVLRFATCPDRCVFMKSILNISDIIAAISFILGTVLEILIHDTDNPSLALQYFYMAMRPCAIFRFVRLFRVVRKYRAVKVFELSVRSSLRDLCILFIIVAVGSIVFATLVYYAEYRDRKVFSHIPISIWWAVITMTTVGYGDYVPTTLIGRIVGGLCAVVGILLLAVPIPILTKHYASYSKFSRLHVRLRDKRLALKHSDSVKRRNKIFLISEPVVKTLKAKSKEID